jgi:hypothetical protein
VEDDDKVVLNGLTVDIGEKAIAVVAGVSQGRNLAGRGGLGQFYLGGSKVRGARLISLEGL